MGRNDNGEIGFKHSRYAPFDPLVQRFYCWRPTLATPYEYSGWQKETLSWKENCYLHTFLSDICCAVTTKGPDAEKLLRYMCVNNFSIDRFPIGRAKHIIACTPIGTIASHGMCLRIAEDEFVTYFMEPNVSALSYSGKFNVEPPNNDMDADFLFQLAGPKALEIVEHAIRQDIHDLKFMQFTSAKIAGYDVRILRMGMGGTLSYEVHGTMDHVFEIYDEIMRVGEPYGITKMGVRAYMCNHTENGLMLQQ
jgi:glycine cleavage system aminomethyltransferase T